MLLLLLVLCRFYVWFFGLRRNAEPQSHRTVASRPAPKTGIAAPSCRKLEVTLGIWGRIPSIMQTVSSGFLGPTSVPDCLDLLARNSLQHIHDVKNTVMLGLSSSWVLLTLLLPLGEYLPAGLEYAQAVGTQFGVHKTMDLRCQTHRLAKTVWHN